MELTVSATACSTSDISAIQVVAILALIRHPRFGQFGTINDSGPAKIIRYDIAR